MATIPIIYYYGSTMSSQNKSEKVTIKYLAKKSGFSASTVSRALRGDPAAKEETKRKILKIAEDLNYYPNLLAKGLRDKKTKTVGLILNDLKNPLYYETIDAIGQALDARNYTMILCDSNYDQQLERKNIINMLAKGVDGIIISLVNAKSENIKLIRDNGLAAVYIDCRPDFKDINFVYVDHQKAAFDAAGYLIGQGHKQILLLNGPSQLSSSKNYLKGYLKALKKYGIGPQEELVKNVDLSIQAGCRAMKECHRQKDKYNFRAVVTLSDIVAIGIYEAARELKFSIPDDYSVIGYDNIMATAYLCPPLTTVHQPKIRTGSYSAKILLEKMENISADFTQIILEPRLVIRESVKRL